jgi:hypothetical protein
MSESKSKLTQGFFCQFFVSNILRASGKNLMDRHRVQGTVYKRETSDIKFS